MRYKINSTGNTVIADQAFMDAVHLGDYAVLPDDVAPVPTTDAYIAVGSFFDRFGALQYAILSSIDPIVQALITNASVRVKTGINLKSAATSLGIDILIAKGFAVDKAAILDAPVQDNERP